MRLAITISFAVAAFARQQPVIEDAREMQKYRLVVTRQGTLREPDPKLKQGVWYRPGSFDGRRIRGLRMRPGAAKPEDKDPINE